jgi:beta-xylosidase
VRFTHAGGMTRLFYRWQGNRITDTKWQPMGVAMQADVTLGETQGGLQAPHVFTHNGVYYMVYGDWVRICLASSTDGKVFQRVRNTRGQPDRFSGPYNNTRDAMVLRSNGLFFCYSMGSWPSPPHLSAIFCRTSADLAHWSEPMIVSAGGIASTPPSPADAECPFVVERNGWYYMFRNQIYGPNALNTQYASRNPLAFGVDDDRYRIGTLPVAAPEIILSQGQYYIAALNPNLDGIRIARLRFVDR